MREDPIEPTVSIGPFVFDRKELTLTRGGVEVAVPERSLRLLESLIGSAGKTISKDQLVDEVWEGASVSDTSLTEAMSRLRRALGDEPREPRYVQTVHGRGYRFISSVREGRRHFPSLDSRKRAWLGGSIVASAALVGALWVGAAVVVGSFPPTDKPRGISTEMVSMIFEPFQGLAGALGGRAPNREAPPPRYRLGEVAATGERVWKYSIPALPLSSLSVDRAGNRLAFSMADGAQSDVWVLEPARGELRRVATGGYFSDPVWRPNGREVAMAAGRESDFDLALMEVEGDSSERLLLEAPFDQFPESWSRDGRSLVYSERHPETGYDLWLLRQSGDDSWTTTPLVRTLRDEAFAAVSPNGRYVAYASAAGRRSDIFVVDLELDRVPFRVSPDGGAYPFWSAAGDDLRYVKGDDIWAVGADQFGGDATRASRISTTVAGLYLAGSVAADDRIVVAMLE